MKTKEKKDLLSKNAKELSKMVQDAKEALFNMTLEKTQNKLKNTSSIRNKKREIANILTILKVKEFENAKDTNR